MKFKQITVTLLTISLAAPMYAGNARSTNKKSQKNIAVQSKTNYVGITRDFVRYLGINNVKLVTDNMPSLAHHAECIASDWGHVTGDTIYLNATHLHNRNDAESIFACAHLAAHYAHCHTHNREVASLLGLGVTVSTYFFTQKYITKPLSLITSGLLGPIAGVVYKQWVEKRQEVDADATAAQVLCTHGYAWVVKQLLLQWEHDSCQATRYAHINTVWHTWSATHTQEAQQASKHAQENITNDLQIMLSDTQRTQLHTILAAAQQAVVATNIWFDQFFSTNNNESYNTHLDKLQSIVQNIDEHIRKPLHACNGRGALFTTAEEIITTLYEQMYLTYTTLDKFRNTRNPLVLGTQLRKLDQTVNSTQAQQALDTQLHKLFNILQEKEPQLAQDVQKLHTTIKQNRLDRNKQNIASYANGLAHRMQC